MKMGTGQFAEPAPQSSDAIAARYGYTIVDGDDIGPTLNTVATLKPREFLRGEPWINGVELRKRAVELRGNLSLVDGQRIVDEQDTNPVPAEFQGHYIPLTGTLLRHSGGGLYLACLDFRGSRWCLDFDRLDGDWCGGDRLACTE